MSKQKYASLTKYYDDLVNQMINECTLCGECVRNCPLSSLGPLKGKEPSDIMEKIVNFLKGGDSSEEVYFKAFACNSCRSCTYACPVGIDVMQLFAAVRDKLVKQGKFPEGVGFVDFIPGMWGIITSMQVKPDEKRWLSKVPSKPKKADHVVWLGCTLPSSSHTVLALLDVIDRTGIDYVALAGGEYCCGFPYFAAGKIESLEKKSKELINSIEAFSPKKLILPCAGCYRQFTELYPLFTEYNFEVQYYADFLKENLEKLNINKPVDKTIYYHASCMSRSTKANELLGQFLESIPGLKVAKGKTVCCGGTPKLAFPEIPGQLAPAFKDAIIKETTQNKADYLVNLCQLCDLTFSPMTSQCSFGVKDVPSLINEFAGGKKYTNYWLEYWKYKNEDDFIEKTRETFEANGLNEEQVRQVLPMILSWRGE